MQSIAGTRPKPAAKTLMQDAEALHGALSELVRIYQFRDRDRICCHDISVTQCYALEALVEHGPMRSQALARRLMLDKSTTTRVVDALAEIVTKADRPANVLICGSLYLAGVLLGENG